MKRVAKDKPPLFVLKKIICLFSIPFLFFFSLRAELCLGAGTKVKTPKGYILVENLQSDDFVCCYDLAKKEYAIAPIVIKESITVPQYVKLTINKKEIVNVNISTWFWDAYKLYVKAYALSLNSYLMRSSMPYAMVKEIKCIHAPMQLYSFIVPGKSNCFISSEDIMILDQPYGT